MTDIVLTTKDVAVLADFSYAGYMTSEELRDAISSGQLDSKNALLRALKKLPPPHFINNVYVAAAWHGMILMPMARVLWEKQVSPFDIVAADINPVCVKMLWSQIGRLSTERLHYVTGRAVCEDVLTSTISPRADLYVNTAVEHFEAKAMHDHLHQLKSGCMFVLQANSCDKAEGHIHPINHFYEFDAMLPKRTYIETDVLQVAGYERRTVAGVIL